MCFLLFSSPVSINSFCLLLWRKLSNLLSTAAAFCNSLVPNYHPSISVSICTLLFSCNHSSSCMHDSVCIVSVSLWQRDKSNSNKMTKNKSHRRVCIKTTTNQRDVSVISKTGNCHFLNKGENNLTEDDESVCRNICVHCLLRYLQVCLFRSCICKTHTVERKLCFSGPASERQKLHFTGKRTKKMTKESMNFEQAL